MPKPVDVKRASLYNVELRPGHPPVGYFNALVHMLKGNIGIGLFAMGDAFKNGGLYVSVPLILVIALICIHCQHLLVDCADRVTAEYNKDDDPADYAIAVELCFENGPEKISKLSARMATCINTFICITQLCFCCVYLVFISSNLKQVLDANGVHIDLRLLILVVWFPIWLSCLTTNLNALAPVSMASNVLLFASFIATIIFAFMDGIPLDINHRRSYTTPKQFALFFGTIIFSFEGIALVMPIKNAMRKPKQFAAPFGVLNVGMTIVMTMYILTGLAGYLKWGEKVKGSLTLNLGNSIAAQCVKVAVSLGIMLTYALQFFVPIQILLPSFLQKTCLTEKPYCGELLFRTLLTICTVIVAEMLPNVGMFISLIGAFCSSALALVFPPMLECLLLHQTFHSRCIKGLILLKNFLIILLGLLGFVVGTVISLIDIFEYYKENGF